MEFISKENIGELRAWIKHRMKIVHSNILHNLMYIFDTYSRSSVCTCSNDGPDT